MTIEHNGDQIVPTNGQRQSHRRNNSGLGAANAAAPAFGEIPTTLKQPMP
jgi:hypothetical protein